ncbi:hypothetical protein SAMN05421508_106346 [Caenispirillum bisanense]|uniref:Uncharacterized protein n=1 Tax=Caenispirillum bisanense TaxID=414052 RepID=A0A286GNY3_9PROT|nr:hypothetical protein SAMN05421508_106346 [Caenispirillum bisanense]
MPARAPITSCRSCCRPSRARPRPPRRRRQWPPRSRLRRWPQHCRRSRPEIAVESARTRDRGRDSNQPAPHGAALVPSLHVVRCLALLPLCSVMCVTLRAVPCRYFETSSKCGMFRNRSSFQAPSMSQSAPQRSRTPRRSAQSRMWRASATKRGISFQSTGWGATSTASEGSLSCLLYDSRSLHLPSKTAASRVACSRCPSRIVKNYASGRRSDRFRDRAAQVGEERWPRLFGQFGGRAKLVPFHDYAARAVAGTVSGARPGDGAGAAR